MWKKTVPNAQANKSEMLSLIAKARVDTEIQKNTPYTTATQGYEMEKILIMTAILAVAGCEKMDNHQTMTVNESTSGHYTQSQSGIGNKQEMSIGGTDNRIQNQSGVGNEQSMKASGSGTAIQNQSGSGNKQTMNTKSSGTVIQNQSSINREQTIDADGDKNSVIIQNNK